MMTVVVLLISISLLLILLSIYFDAIISDNSKSNDATINDNSKSIE